MSQNNILKSLSELFKVHNNASIRSERMFGKGKLDEIQSDNCIGKFSHDVSFDKKILIKTMYIFITNIKGGIDS